MSSSRFDLEKAVAAWRRPLEHKPTFSGEDLEELEGGLRDRFENLVEQGLPEKEAFEKALRRIGSYGTAEEEYRKVYWGKVRRQRHLTSELVWRLSMLTNYLKVALRNLRRQKGYTFINIAGLALGLTCCLLIFQYVAFEYSFDRFHENERDLFRLTRSTVRTGEQSAPSGGTPHAMGPALAAAVPEILNVARLLPEYTPAVVSNPERPERVFEEDGVFHADPAFLKMFTFPLLTGAAEAALTEPGTVLLSASAALKYFGTENPVGQMLSVASGESLKSYLVTGVFRDVPANSHLQFDVLLPLDEALRTGVWKVYESEASKWDWNSFITYIQLRPDAGLAEVERKMTDVLLAHRGDALRQQGMIAHVFAQPLRDVHLNADISAPKAVMGSYRTVYFFILIGLVTLFIALLNYVNLATARALDRAREVGVRKVVGANRNQLIIQFLTESALTNIVAVILAVILAVLFAPVVNRLVETRLTGVLWMNPWFWTAFLSTLGACTLLAGLYPAFILSSFRPISVLKGKAGSFTARRRLRRGLVVLQFAASVVLIGGTIVVYNQLGYMRRMDLGLDLEQVLTVTGPRVLPAGTDQARAITSFAEELRQLPAVRLVATSATLPGQGFIWGGARARRAEADPITSIPAEATFIDSSFAAVYGLELIAGKGFADITETGSAPYPMLANQSAVRALGFARPADALDQALDIGGYPARIVGVLRDFNWSSAHQARQNIFFGRFEEAGPQVSIRVSTDDLSGTIAAVESIYNRLFPGNVYRYAFADESFDRQYRNDERFATLFSLFAGLAVAIACLGLFGLASFTAQQRTKEIGVRKVLGASVLGIVSLFSREFLQLVGLAYLLAVPVVYLVMQRWLEDFAYRIAIGPGVFLFTGGVVVLIAILTVSYQSIKAALADPVKSLRYE